MSGAATIVVAREDFSIPGAPGPDPSAKIAPASPEVFFFNLLRDSRPDVVVLDLSQANGSGVDTILKIRRHSVIPILVVCDVDDPASRAYRIAGAAECIPAPVDILLLNQVLQQIINISRQVNPRGVRIADAVTFAGLTFRPHRNLLESASGPSVKLTSSESRLLLHFVSHPWVLHSRVEVSEMLYGRHRPTSDRAIDVVVNRLRKKLTSLAGPTGHNLIKTEFRRGYMLIADVATASLADAAPGFAAPNG
jgi:two-component system, OmpR family, response regulator